MLHDSARSISAVIWGLGFSVPGLEIRVSGIECQVSGVWGVWGVRGFGCAFACTTHGPHERDEARGVAVNPEDEAVEKDKMHA
jgi:hypothetical protein